MAGSYSAVRAKACFLSGPDQSGPSDRSPSLRSDISVTMSSFRTSSDRWPTSRRLLERSKKSLAGGVSSPFRAKAPVPLFLADALGSKIIDVDGNEYIDYSLAWGPLILGHRHPALVETLLLQAERPHNYGAQHELEFIVAEAIQWLIPCAERVCFTSSGSEAVQILLRLARAFTKRNLIVRFEGHYHGWMDSVLLSYRPKMKDLVEASPFVPIIGSSGQVSNSTANMVVLPWNDREKVDQLFCEHGHELAAVVMEPVLCNSGCLLPHDGYLEHVATVARRYGALVLFDEVITGFRMSVGGAQRVYGVTPDIASFGKAVGGGLPLSLIAGRAEIIEMIFGGGVAFGGTFNGNPVSLAAGETTISELTKDGQSALRRANELGEDLKNALQAAARSRGLPLHVTGFGTAFALHFNSRQELRDYRDILDDDQELLDLCLFAALEEGINILPDGRMYVSTVHSPADIEQTIASMERVFDLLSANRSRRGQTISTIA